MGKYIDGSGLSHFMGIIKGWAFPKADVPKQAITYARDANAPDVLALGIVADGTATNFPVASTSNSGLMSKADKTKLNGVATGAEVNQNAFSNVVVGSTTVAADAKTDSLTLAGSNVTLTPDATSDKVTIGITAANVTTALGNTAVARATADASGNNIASTYATKSELGSATAGALQYKGTATKESDISGQAYKKGWYYVVSTAGTYFGKVCEVGDMLIAKQDKTSTPANDWDAIQSNIEVLSNAEIDTLWAAA